MQPDTRRSARSDCGRWVYPDVGSWDLYGNDASPSVVEVVVAVPCEPPPPAVVCAPETYQPAADEGTETHAVRQASALARLLARAVPARPTGR